MTVMMSGCAKYQASSLSQALNGAQGASVDTPQAAYAKLNLTGAPAAGRYAGLQVLGLDKLNKQLLVSLPILGNAYLDNNPLSAALSRFAGVKLNLKNQEATDSSGSSTGTLLTLQIPLSLVTKGLVTSNPAKLPNGKALPGVTSGQLPSESVAISTLSNIKANVYVGKNVVGIFVGASIDPLFDYQASITSPDQSQNWGTLYQLKASTFGGTDGGFFILVSLPDSVGTLIDTNL